MREVTFGVDVECSEAVNQVEVGLQGEVDLLGLTVTLNEHDLLYQLGYLSLFWPFQELLGGAQTGLGILRQRLQRFSRVELVRTDAQDAATGRWAAQVVDGVLARLVLEVLLLI